MKKVTITLRALALVLVAMPVMANGNNIGGEPEASIDVNITVAAYAEITPLGSVEIDIDEPGKASGTADFDVLANFTYGVDVDENGNFGDLEWDASVSKPSGEGEAGKTTTWTLTVKTNPNWSVDNLDYVLADEYSGDITVSVVPGSPKS